MEKSSNNAEFIAEPKLGLVEFNYMEDFLNQNFTVLSAGVLPKGRWHFVIEVDGYAPLEIEMDPVEQHELLDAAGTLGRGIEDHLRKMRKE